jgi:hypothetical protein
MSDEQQEQVGAADDETDDVEGHLMSHNDEMSHQDEMDQVGAQEEPPDVEGHSFGAAAAAQKESREP